MNKPFLSAFLVALIVCGFVVCGSLQVVVAQDYTEVTGILSADTTWTKSASPYSLTGPVLVDDGITLTIEAGVTVYLNEHYIQVEGTLYARGSNTDKIYFINGSDPGDTPDRDDNWAINFDDSDPWNEQTESGSIIENAVLDSAGICVISDVKISSNVINASCAVDIFESGFVLSDNIINGRIMLHESVSDVTITNNVVTNGKIEASSHDGSVVISNNTVQNGGGSAGVGISCGNVHVYDNVISDCGWGIHVYGDSLIERNLIINNDIGITFSGSDTEPMIRNNTITNNSVGIEIAGPYSPSPTIIYNNIVNNTQNVYLSDTSDDYNVTYNWWGTTDSDAINQSIFDFKNDFNLGKVTFTPFLTEPNPNAPEIPEFPTWIILPMILALSLVIAVFRKRNKSFN